MSEPADRRIAELAHRQGGHVMLAQLREVGIGRGSVDRRIARGSLIRIHRGVYAVGHVPAHPLDRAQGALLAAGPRAALSGRSAAAFWGIDRDWHYPLELVAPADHRISTLVVHHCSTLLRRDIRELDGIRVTSPARTLLDIAPSMTTRRLTRAVNDLRHARRLTLNQLDDIAARNSRHPGARRLAAIAGTSQQEPTRSELEDAYLALVERYGLPTPQINVDVAGYRVDAYYPDHELVVELDGWLTHQTRQAFVRDRKQDAEILARTGISTVRLTYGQTTRSPAHTAAELMTILEARDRRKKHIA